MSYGENAECGAMGAVLFLIVVAMILLALSGVSGLVFRDWKR